MVGVLAAQAVADWASDRAEHAETRELVARLDEQNQRIVESALIWDVALPCLRERVETVMIRAADGAPIGADLARRPTFWTTENAELDPGDWSRVRRHVDPDTASRYARATNANTVFQEDLLAVAASWERFSQMDPRLGQPTDADRSAVRMAGGEILARLRGMENDVRNILSFAKAFGISPAQSVDQQGRPVRPATSCAEIDATGRTNVPVLADEAAVAGV